jgi:carboxylate-amine ligase
VTPSDPALRRTGVEEEFLLVDPDTGSLRPEARRVLDGCRARLGGWPNGWPTDTSHPEAKQEFFQEQVELATRPCRTMGELSDQLRSGRETLAESAGENGVAAVAIGLPPYEGARGTLSRSPRFEEIGHEYGALARWSLMCALHVHVQVADEAEAIGVLDRMRPWLPLIVAMSSNSPYQGGADTGFHSWRSRVWEMWPSSGPPEAFGDVSTFRATVDRLVAWGAARDSALLNFGIRPSARFPTVEVRVADTCTNVSDTLLIGAVVRALVETCATQWRAGETVPTWRSEELRAAHWRAGRYGLGGELVDPVEKRLVPASEALHRLVHETAAALGEAGDVELVTTELTRLLTTGTGADRQRDVFSRTDDLREVVADAARRTRGALASTERFRSAGVRTDSAGHSAT